MAGFEPGELFADRYEIIKHLGRGGMGMVYLVKDWRSETNVALKTLLPKYTENKQAVRRFEREISASQQLDHPCIVKVFDSGEWDGALYYTMEYIDGKSVRMWMRERKKNTGKAIGLGSTVRILSLLCSALEHAHKITIHRDLSPENAMVMRNGDVKLLDFGLAKLSTTNADLTRVGVSLGKIQYCAPEQRIDAKNVDLRADIYSLGVMFYEMLSGELPLDDTPLSERVPGLPPEVDGFVARAMAENPEDRFANAKAFRFALTAIYEHAKTMKQEKKKSASTPRSERTSSPKRAVRSAPRPSRKRSAPPTLRPTGMASEARPSIAIAPQPKKKTGMVARFRGAIARIFRRTRA